MNKYIKGWVVGLPTPKRTGWNTSKNKLRKDKEYIFKVVIGKGYTMYKFHMKRGGVSKIKYFKTLKEAKTFSLMLRENRYL